MFKIFFKCVFVLCLAYIRITIYTIWSDLTSRAYTPVERYVRSLAHDNAEIKWTSSLPDRTTCLARAHIEINFMFGLFTYIKINIRYARQCTIKQKYILNEINT